ncbi:hypothetical protein RBU49_02645 [Clostridium sp. MB40-C1]|uniref:hypothetical protein n=1 Tax=Clostridium sp. MB40-C1 TaxID=3070996 RepID=UPI0027E1F212|nr:hypothetical protein [Clostridium sp. MB40-C1]WMJ81168.1 hypothetical protein RBU49_02645 [Clostridium sp. MB40-C1]
MRVYSKGFKEAEDTINKYKNRGEETRVSIPIQYNGELYREIMFIKREQGNRIAVGYLYIDDENKEVEDKSIARQLAKLGYYLNIFYNDESSLYIKRAMEGIQNIKNQKIEYSKLCFGLDKLKSEGEKGTDKTKEIIDEVIKLRIKNDDKISELLSLAENHINDNKFYGEDIFESLYSLYKEIMMLNFNRVKIIDSGKEYYDSIENKAKKRKGSLLTIFIGRNKCIPFIKLESLINNYKKILSTYEKILDMDESKYEKFLINVEKDNINLKMDVLRNIRE